MKNNTLEINNKYNITNHVIRRRCWDFIGYGTCVNLIIKQRGLQMCETEKNQINHITFIFV